MAENIKLQRNEMSDVENKTCVICNQQFIQEKLVKVQRGIATIVNCAEQKNDSIVLARCQTSDRVYVRENCRRSYIDKRAVPEDQSESTSIKVSQHHRQVSPKRNYDPLVRLSYLIGLQNVCIVAKMPILIPNTPVGPLKE